MNKQEELVEHVGNCHCGDVVFKATAPADLVVWDCNCSVCKMKRNTHFVVPSTRFELVKGKDSLTTYTFNTHAAKHMFCKRCGVQAFYIPRSNPDGVAVTIHCITSNTVRSVKTNSFDGQNWENFIDKSGIKEHSKL